MKNSLTMKIFKLLVLFIFIFSCNHNKNKIPVTKQTNIKEKVVFDSTKIDSFFIKFPKLKSIKKELVSFYSNQNYTFIWFVNNKVKAQSTVLQNQIKTISSDGFINNTKLLKDSFAILNLKKVVNPNLETELMLTANYFIYAKKVWYGLSEEQSKKSNWYLPRKKLNYNKLLDSIVNGNAVLVNPPIFGQYLLLKKELKNYQKIKQNGGFPSIEKELIGLKMGDSSVQILKLKKYLLLSKDLTEKKSTALFDTNLQNAIIKIKTRFGLKVNDAITSSLLKQMNISVDDRIQQIALNMERCRWLPVKTKTDYLCINIPEYKMHVYEKNKLIWSMNAVVGTLNHETSLFADKIEYVVFSPFWNVPKSILKKEILPGIAANKNYLKNHNMEWFKGNVRQKPGANNSLGSVKFLFPNSFEIYLHDTPDKGLFNQNNRAFSHGCIRLQNAEKLAKYLLKNEPKWPIDSIKFAMHDTIEKYVKVKKREDVFIVYFTSWVDNSVQLNFRKDIYKLDEKLKIMLKNN